MPNDLQQLSDVLTQRLFKTINIFPPPADMGPNDLMIADNLYLFGGEARLRPGKIAKLTNAFGGALFISEVYVKPDQSTALLLCSGGKIYQWNNAASVANELLLNGAWNYTDLVIQADTTKVASAARPFISSDVGLTLTIVSGTGFTVGSYTVNAVVAGVATLSAAVGTTASTGGTGVLGTSFNINTTQVQWARGGKFMYVVDGIQNVTNLAIDGSDSFKVTSASHTFRIADVGKRIQVTKGTGFNLKTYRIGSVSSGAATLTESAGTIGSTSGAATILGPLYRININTDNTYSASVVTALTPPDIPTSAILTSTVIDACNDYTKWSSFPALNPVLVGATSNETVTNNTYVGITSTASNPPPDGWEVGGDSLDDGNQANRVYFDVGAGPSWIDWVVPVPSYATTIQIFTDIVIQASNTQVKSATRTFRSTDAGALILITSGTNFTTGVYKITAVSAAGVATLDRAVGTAAATGGHGTMTQADSTIRYSRVWVAQNHIYGTGQVDMIFIPEWSGNFASGGTAIPAQSQGLIQVTDLVIDGSNNKKVTSAQRPFVGTGGPTSKGDIGKVITITDGTGFNLGNHTIVSVTSGAAILMASAGTLSSTGGKATLSFDSSQNSGGTWGQNNYTLQQGTSSYVSEVQTAIQDFPYKVVGNGSLKNTQIVSFTKLANDCEALRYRQQGAATNSPTGADSPSFIYVDNRLITETSQTNTIHVKANNITGGNCLGNCYIRRDYGGTVVNVSDLVIESVTATQSVLSSASYNFVAGDVGRVVAVLGASATGWTVGNYVIVSVAANKATVTGVVGTALSAGGVAQVVSVQDYSLSSAIAIQYSAPASSGVIPFRLGFQTPGQTPAQITWTNPCIQVSDSSGTYLSIDISTVNVSILSQVQYLYLQITADLQATVNLSDLFTFGPITNAGNLTIGSADYSYATTEVNDTRYTVAGVTTGVTTDGQIESDGSQPTINVMPSPAKAQVVLVLAAPVNASANYLYLYRYGGVLADNDITPTARLVAKLPLWTDTLEDQYTDYITWNHTTRTVTDNTPDLALELRLPPTLATGRGAPPFGSQAVAIWQDHVALANGSTIYVSWLLGADQAAGLYYNPTAPFPFDPYATVKGGVYPVGSADNDTVLSLISYSAHLFAEKNRSTWALIGTDATNIVCLEMFTKAAANASIGAVAPRGWGQTVDSIWFLGPDCVWGYDGSGSAANPVSLEIEPYIYPPSTGQPGIASSVLRNAVMCFHGRRMYLFMPTAAFNYTDLANVSGDTTYTQIYSIARPFLPTDVGKALTFSANGINGSPPNGSGGGFTAGAYTINSVSNGIATLASAPCTAYTISGVASLPADANNTVAYVYDSRQDGWTRFLNMNVTSASSLSAQENTDDLYVGGLDGQLYQISYAQYGDVLTVGGSATAIPWMIQSRGIGRESGEFHNSGFWQENNVQRMYAKYTLGESTSMMLACGVVRKNFLDIHTRTRGPGAGIMDRIEVRNETKGDAAFVRVSGSTKTNTILTAFGLEMTKGDIDSTP